MTTKKKTTAATAKKQGAKKTTAPNSGTMNPELREYCKRRQAETEAEWEKAKKEGRVTTFEMKDGRVVELKPAIPGDKPQPLSELEQRARKMALAGIRALRDVAYMAQFYGYPDCDEGNSDEDKALLSAGKWGEALRAVSESLWALDADVGGLMFDAGFEDADNAVRQLEAEEKHAKREARKAKRKSRLAIAKAGFHPNSAAAELVRAGIMPA